LGAPSIRISLPLVNQNDLFHFPPKKLYNVVSNSAEQPWITLPGTKSGSNGGTVPAGSNASGLAAGTYKGTERISASGVSPVDVGVTLTVAGTTVSLTPYRRAVVKWDML
jgi:hypothetical protein